MKNVTCLIIPLLLCFLATANSAEQEVFAEKEYRKSARGEGALTVKMIEKCVKLKHDMDDQHANAEEEKSELETRDQENQDLANELEASQVSIDPSDSAAIDEYNKKVELLNSKNAEYIELKEQYNSKVEPYKKQAKKFDKDCKDQPYYEDDYEAVVKKLGYGL